MNLLFIHQNYPAQFARLAGALARQHVVVAVGVGDRAEATIGRVKYRSYRQFVSPLEATFPPLEHLGEQVRRGRAVAALLSDLKADGFRPDVVVAHPGWGEAMFIRDIYPEARFVAYLEYYYRNSGSDLDFDPEFPVTPSDLPYVRLKNVTNTMALEDADLCITATNWQASTFPANLRGSLTVLHDGIDTQVSVPDAGAQFQLPNGRHVSRADEIVTFVSRSLEPYRGFHVFMRALPELMRRRPSATVLIVGGDDVSYGRGPRGGGTWRQRLLEEVGDAVDESRLFFLGRVSHADFRRILQISSVHVYLTYPFVLSWSLLEAMATGCAIVASATAPVAEVVIEGANGRLCDFFDRAQLVSLVEELLDDSPQRVRLGRAARERMVEGYDFGTTILPRYREMLDELATSASA